MSGARLLLASRPRGDDQFAQIPPFPGAGLVQVLVPRPNHAAMGHCRGRSMGISPRNAASHDKPGGAAGYLQSWRFYLGFGTEVVPEVVCCCKSLAAGQCVVGLSEIDAADNDGGGSSQQFPDLCDVVRFTPCVAHDRPCVKNDGRLLRFQVSAPSSGSTSYQPSFPKARTLTIPWRPKSTRVPGYIFLMAARSSRYSDMISSASGAKFSSQNFLNSAIAASFSSRGRKWKGTFAGSADSRSFCSEGASWRATFSTSPMLQKFHVIATPFNPPGVTAK